jgi:hypothetical protein
MIGKIHLPEEKPPSRNQLEKDARTYTFNFGSL